MSAQAPPPLSVRERLAITVRMPRRGRGFWYGMAIELIWPFLALFTRLGWRGGEHLPPGGFLLAVNHVSFADPIVDTAFVLAQGRVPRYLAKADLWRMPVGKWVMAGGRHIPVRRATIAAGDAYRGAVDTVGRGECLVVYPESTYTRRADGWPMRGMNGVARIALATGVPVVPMAHWGNQDVVPPGRRGFPRLLPRRPVRVAAGPPLDLSRFAGLPPRKAVLDEVTAEIMDAITGLLAGLRGEAPPADLRPGASGAGGTAAAGC
jgi:1-acyl-sn-glycerol-3-phosphate acyltransferase